MKQLTKDSLAHNLDEKAFHTPIRDSVLKMAAKNNLLLIYSNHLDFIRFDGAFAESIYADCTPIYLTPDGLKCHKNEQECVEINPYKFGRRGSEELSKTLYSRLGKPVWDFLTDEITGKAAPFRIRERQDFGEGATYFCRGIVLDLHEFFPA